MRRQNENNSYARAIGCFPVCTYNLLVPNDRMYTCGTFQPLNNLNPKKLWSAETTPAVPLNGTPR